MYNVIVKRIRMDRSKLMYLIDHCASTEDIKTLIQDCEMLPCVMRIETEISHHEELSNAIVTYQIELNRCITTKSHFTYEITEVQLVEITFDNLSLVDYNQINYENSILLEFKRKGMIA